MVHVGVDALHLFFLSASPESDKIFGQHLRNTTSEEERSRLLRIWTGIRATTAKHQRLTASPPRLPFRDLNVLAAAVFGSALDPVSHS